VARGANQHTSIDNGNKYTKPNASLNKINPIFI